MTVKLCIDNIITRTECPKLFDVENIVRYSEAIKDLGLEAAKFCFLTPTSNRVVVNVFASGKITCTGAKSVNRAKQCTFEILEKLAVAKPYDFAVKHIIMSGFLEGVSGRQVLDRMERLSESYDVKHGRLLPSVVIDKDGGLHVEIYHTVFPVKIKAHGTDEESLRKEIDRMYKIITEPKKPES